MYLFSTIFAPPQIDCFYSLVDISLVLRGTLPFVNAFILFCHYLASSKSGRFRISQSHVLTLLWLKLRNHYCRFSIVLSSRRKGGTLFRRKGYIILLQIDKVSTKINCQILYHLCIYLLMIFLTGVCYKVLREAI